MNQKLKKILTKSLIIFGILIPTVTVSTSLVLSCSSSNDPSGNPGGSDGSGGSNGGGSSGGNGSNGGSGTGDATNQKHVLNFKSNLMADPSSGQKQVQFDIENQDAGAIYFESEQKEQELLQLFQDVKDNKIMWINEETLEPIKYEFTMTLKQGMTIGYEDMSQTWNYRYNCYKNVAINGDIIIKIPFQVDNQFYDGSIAPRASDFRYLKNMDKSDHWNNPSGVVDGKISYSFFPPLKDWYIFTEGYNGQIINNYFSYRLEINTEKQTNNSNRIYMSIRNWTSSYDESKMSFEKFLLDYKIYDASQDSSIFIDPNLNINKFYVPQEMSAQNFNGNAYLPNDDIVYSKYKFADKSANIGTFSIKQVQ